MAESGQTRKDEDLGFCNVTEMLRPSELFATRSRSHKIPLRGQKDFLPDGSEEQRQRLERSLQEHWDLLSEERVERLGSLVKGLWIPEEGVVELQSPAGKFWQTMGFSERGKQFLLPEEALYLMECGSVQVFSRDLPLSIQDGYERFLSQEAVSLQHYQVFGHLKRLGYIVTRFDPGSRAPSLYERRLNLPQGSDRPGPRPKRKRSLSPAPRHSDGQEGQLGEKTGQVGHLGEMGQEGHSGEKMEREGQLGEKMGQEGQLGEKMGREGQLVEKMGREGQLGEKIGQEGQLGEKMGREGQLGEKMGREGQLGEKMGREGQLGEKMGQEGQLGEKMGREGQLGEKMELEGDAVDPRPDSSLAQEEEDEEERAGRREPVEMVSASEPAPGRSWWAEQKADPDPRPTRRSGPRWDFSTISFPDLGCGGPFPILATPDPAFLPGPLSVGPCDIAPWLRGLNTRDERLSRRERERERARSHRDVNEDREVRRCQNWAEYRHLLERRSQRSQRERPAHLWEGQVKPLLQPGQYSSPGDLMNRIGVIRSSHWLEGVTQLGRGSEGWRVFFDVYQPDAVADFKKTSPGKPYTRVCVCRFEGPVPDLRTLKLLAFQSGDVPVTFAVVDHGDISFYTFKSFQLPTDLCH